MMAKCPECGHKPTKKLDGGATLLRSRYLIMEPSGVLLQKCPRCSTVYPLGKEIVEQLQKAIFLKQDRPLQAYQQIEEEN